MAVSCSSLNNLPVEIIRLITAPLARKELKALRGTNRKLHSIASETLFETIAIATNDASYIQLLNIAASKVWSTQVRHIDWVLLHPGICHDTRSPKYDNFLAQRLRFNEPWDTTLRKWQMDEVARPNDEAGIVYSGLNLQCELVRRFPNVQTVRFWSAVDSQRFGREPWEYESSRGSAIETNEIVRGDIHDIPSIDDVTSILRFSNLKPRLIKTVTATLYLKFSTSKRFLKGVQIESNRSGDSLQNNPESYRGASDHKEKTYFMFSMTCLESLVKSGTSSLTILRICGVWIHPECIGILLKANIKLRKLYIGDVVFHDTYLFPDAYEKEPLTGLLLLLKDQYNQGCLLKLKVTFHRVRWGCHPGRFSASEHEMQAWMEGRNDELPRTALSTFTSNGHESIAGLVISSDENEKARLEMEDIEDMDFEDEETGYHDIGTYRHKKFDKSHDSEDYKIVVEAMRYPRYNYAIMCLEYTHWLAKCLERSANLT